MRSVGALVNVDGASSGHRLADGADGGTALLLSTLVCRSDLNAGHREASARPK